MPSNIEPVSIPQLSNAESKNRKQTPKLWNLPKVDKSFQRNLDALRPYQKTYTDILYKVGKNKYGLIPEFDFTVEVILPTGKFSELSYDIIAGPTCHLIMTVCSISEFEKLLCPILEKVRNSVHSKSLDRVIALRKREKEIKKLIPPFILYDLEDHHLEIKREQKITIFDPTTGITVTRITPAETEPWRIMTHWAKMELIKLNKLVKEFKSREENYGTPNADANKVRVKSDSNLEG